MASAVPSFSSTRRTSAETPVWFTLLSARAAAASAVASCPFLTCSNFSNALASRFMGSWMVTRSFLVNFSSVSRSLQFLGFTQSSSIAWWLYTFPVVFTATMCVLFVNALLSTGHSYAPSWFLWNVSFVRSLSSSGSPVTGCLPCFCTYGTACMMSITVPSGAHTGSSNGTNDTAQQLNGRRRKGNPSVLSLYPPPSSFHSVAVMYPRSLDADFFPMTRNGGPLGGAPRGVSEAAGRAEDFVT